MGREKLHDLHYLEAILSSLLLHLQGSHASLEKSLNCKEVLEKSLNSIFP